MYLFCNIALYDTRFQLPLENVGVHNLSLTIKVLFPNFHFRFVLYFAEFYLFHKNGTCYLFCFTVRVNNYDWLFYENLFTQNNEDSLCLTRRRIQKLFIQFQNVSTFGTISHTRAELHTEKSFFFLHVIPIYFIASCLHETFKLSSLLKYYIFVLTQKKLNRDNNLYATNIFQFYQNINCARQCHIWGRLSTHCRYWSKLRQGC